MLPAEFFVDITHDHCRRCGRCVSQCGFGALRQKERIIADHKKCVACQRCALFCPEQAIHIRKQEHGYKQHAIWTPEVRNDIYRQARTGGVILVGNGNPMPHPIIWDNLLLDACQVTNPPIDALREPIELRTYLGSKPQSISGELPDQIEIETPIIFPAMSYGAVSLNTQKSLAGAAKELGTLMNTGEGGVHPDLYPDLDNIIVQCASGRFGVSYDYLNTATAVEIKIGQGAKPGIGGHLPGEKVTEDISRTRMIPVGSDALSPSPHHDIYSIEDLSQLIYAIKEATDYGKPVGVKVAAVHNIAAIASGVVRAGADFVSIDGYRGGSGATPKVIRDHVGIPIEIALAVVDERLRREGIRNEASLICSGGFRHAGDVAKAIALGADAVSIGTAALVALGCRVCQQCHTGNCSWGIATQIPELVERLDPAEGTERLVNLVSGWSIELKEILGALGLNSIESLRGNRERLRGFGLNASTLELLGVKEVGEGQ